MTNVPEGLKLKMTTFICKLSFLALICLTSQKADLNADVHAIASKDILSQIGLTMQ